MKNMLSLDGCGDSLFVRIPSVLVRMHSCDIARYNLPNRCCVRATLRVASVSTVRSLIRGVPTVDSPLLYTVRFHLKIPLLLGFFGARLLRSWGRSPLQFAWIEIPPFLVDILSSVLATDTLKYF